MLSTAKTIMMALLLAYRALAAPVSNGSQSQAQVQSVIDALKAQMKGTEMPGPSIIDRIEAALRLNGSLDAEHIAALDQRIQTMTAGRVLDSSSIAAATIDYLNANGAFDQSSQKEVENKVLYLTTDMINDVLAQGGRAVRRDCPHKGKLCGGCVIL